MGSDILDSCNLVNCFTTFTYYTFCNIIRKTYCVSVFGVPRMRIFKVPGQLS